MKDNIYLPLIHIEETPYPIVEGALMCKDNEMLSGYFIIDTGSVENILNYDMAKYISRDMVTEKKQMVCAINGAGENCIISNVTIDLDDNSSCEQFCISQKLDFEKYFGPNRILGLLGSCYLRKHHLAVDFAKKCLRTAAREPIMLDEMSFLFPMQLGMQTYGIPVLKFIKDDTDYFCVADTGCALSMLSEKGKEGVFCCEKSDGKGRVEGISGAAETIHTSASLSLLSVGDRIDRIRLVETEDNFQILQGYEYIVSYNNEQIPSISALLSTHFMLKRKWILDFSNEVIYAKSA